MKKILLIAQSEAKATDAEKNFPGLKVKKVYPGSKRLSRHFEAVVIYHNEVNDVNFMKDQVQRYADAPIKAFIGKVPYPQAGDYKAKAFTHEQLADLIQYLNNQYNELHEVMTKVFQSFDKDSSGFIDIGELADVAKELGRPMDADELEECMKDLDINKDNKISFDEFSKWWLSGRQGLSPFMRRLLAFKLSTVKFFGNIQSSLSEVVQEAASENVEINTSHLSVNINKVQNAGTTISTKLMLLSHDAIEEYKRVRALHSFKLPDDTKPWIANISIEIKDGKASEVQAKVNELL